MLDIKAGHLDLKKELSGFCKTIKTDMMEELERVYFLKEVNQKLNEICAKLGVDEVGHRVATQHLRDSRGRRGE